MRGPARADPVRARVVPPWQLGQSQYHLTFPPLLACQRTRNDHSTRIETRGRKPFARCVVRERMSMLRISKLRVAVTPSSHTLFRTLQHPVSSQCRYGEGIELVRLKVVFTPCLGHASTHRATTDIGLSCGCFLFTPSCGNGAPFASLPPTQGGTLRLRLPTVAFDARYGVCFVCVWQTASGRCV